MTDTTHWKVVIQSVSSQGGLAPMYHVHAEDGRPVVLNVTEADAQSIVRDHEFTLPLRYLESLTNP